MQDAIYLLIILNNIVLILDHWFTFSLFQIMSSPQNCYRLFLFIHLCLSQVYAGSCNISLKKHFRIVGKGFSYMPVVSPNHQSKCTRWVRATEFCNSAWAEFYAESGMPRIICKLGKIHAEFENLTFLPLSLFVIFTIPQFLSTFLLVTISNLL